MALGRRPQGPPERNPRRIGSRRAAGISETGCCALWTLDRRLAVVAREQEVAGGLVPHPHPPRRCRSAAPPHAPATLSRSPPCAHPPPGCRKPQPRHPIPPPQPTARWRSPFGADQTGWKMDSCDLVFQGVGNARFSMPGCRATRKKAAAGQGRTFWQYAIKKWARQQNPHQHQAPA